MKGFGGYVSSPAKQKTDGKGPVRKPNPTVKAEVKKTKFEKMTEEEYQEYMNEKHHSNVPTFANSDDPHKKVKKKIAANKASNKKRSDADRAQDAREDGAGVGSGSNRKVMKDGAKNKAIHKGKPVKGDFTPHQFRKK